MSAAEDELADLLGSVEAVPPIIALIRKQVEIGRALWNDPPTPEAERLKAIAALVRSGEADQPILDAIADLLDPSVENGDEKLVFARRRAGNPKSAGGTAAEIERMMIWADARRLYRQMLAEGHSRHGLKKRVGDLIGGRYSKEGATIDKLWSVTELRHRPRRRRR